MTWRDFAVGVLTSAGLIAAAALIIASFGCRRQAPKVIQATSRASAPLEGAPDIGSESADVSPDLILFVRDHKRLQDGSQAIQVAGTHKGRPVSFEVILGPSWEAGSLGKDIPLVAYRGKVTYRGSGPESDAFLLALDELYGTKLAPRGMSTQTEFSAITLRGDPRDLTQSVKIKLFYEQGGMDAYAELYTNIDLSARRLEVNEKDEAYRAAIVRALTAR